MILSKRRATVGSPVLSTPLLYDIQYGSPYSLPCQWRADYPSLPSQLTFYTIFSMKCEQEINDSNYIPIIPCNINYISLYVLNRETSIGHRPKYELTTHSSTLMMNDHIHAHTPNMLMSLCICNANVTTNSHVKCMMHTTWNILINRTSCQVPCNIYRKHISSIHFMSIFIDIVVSCILAFINT